MDAATVTSDGGRQIAVVVPSHDRALRLRWLLNALEEQTLARDRWEVVVAHDSAGRETDELLQTHPLTERDGLRHVTLPPGHGSPGRLRNAGWRAARASLIVFTDDDCRPPPGWLAEALRAAHRHPGAIVQGATRPDPDEHAILRAAPRARTQRIDPPVPYAQTCNILYPRALLERTGGFIEEPPLFPGEDTDLAIRARALGAAYVGAEDMLTYHAVNADALPRQVRAAWRWRNLPYLVMRHPSIRGDFPLRIFWKRAHAWLPLAIAGALLGRRRRSLWLLALPWAWETRLQHADGPRGALRGLSELPGHAALDTAELAALAWGSVKYRTLFL